MSRKILVVSNANGEAANLLWTRGGSSHAITLCVPGKRAEVGPDPQVEEVVGLPTWGERDAPSSRTWRRGLHSLLRSRKPDVVHFVGEPWYPELMAIFGKTPRLVLHGAENRLTQGNALKDGTRLALAKYHLSRASGVVAWNAAAASCYRRLCSKPQVPMLVVPAHTRLRREGPRLVELDGRNQRLTLIFVGRLVPEKGVPVLIEAVAPLGDMVSLTIVGDGPERERLEKMCFGMSHVTFLGSLPQKDSQDLIGKSDVLVLPSLDAGHVCEQFGLVLVEAMAEGTALLASDACSIPEVVGDSESLFPSGDVAGLRSRILELALDSCQLARKKRMSFDRYSRFCPTTLMGELDGFWSGVARAG